MMSIGSPAASAWSAAGRDEAGGRIILTGRKGRSYDRLNQPCQTGAKPMALATTLHTATIRGHRLRFYRTPYNDGR